MTDEELMRLLEYLRQHLERVEERPRLNDRLLFGWTRWRWIVFGVAVHWCVLFAALWHFDH